MLVSVGSLSCCPLTQKVKLELVDAKWSHHQQSRQLRLGSRQMEEYLLTVVRHAVVTWPRPGFGSWLAPVRTTHHQYGQRGSLQ